MPFSSTSGCYRSADRKPRAVIHTAANEMTPAFSPDGRWLAYASNESGRHEVYVQPYPGPGERHLISTRGGEQPAWNPNGPDLFSMCKAGHTHAAVRPQLMSVRIATTPTFSGRNTRTAIRKRLSRDRVGTQLRRGPGWTPVLADVQEGTATYSAASADGPRAALVRGAEAPRAHPLTFVEP